MEKLESPLKLFSVKQVSQYPTSSWFFVSSLRLTELAVMTTVFTDDQGLRDGVSARDSYEDSLPVSEG